MMARSHSLSGAVAFLAAAPVIGTLTHSPLRPGTLALGAGVCAGAALLPDADHEAGLISEALGPVTEVLTRVVAKLSGGHRHATHSMAFAVAAGLGTWALVDRAGRPAMLALAFACLALGLRAIDLPVLGRRWLHCYGAAALATGAAAWLLPVAWPFLPYAVGLGCLAHLAGDFLTPEGVPLLWPWGVRMEMPVLDITTNSWWERRVVATALVIAVLLLGWIRL